MKLAEFLQITQKENKEHLIKGLKGVEAIEAGKQNGYALQYVSEQTPEICIEAVRQDGDSLRYVDITIFEKDENE